MLMPPVPTAEAEALVTSDALLLGVRRRVDFAIETPKAFLARLDRHAAIGHARAR